MIAFPEDLLAPTGDVPPGDWFFVDGERQVRCTLLARLMVKPSRLTEFCRLQPGAGQLYYRADCGTGAELWPAIRFHERTKREQGLRGFYTEVRAYAVANGKTKQEFDELFMSRIGTMDRLEAMRRVILCSPAHLKEAIHKVFVVINLVASPTERDGQLTEAAREFFVPRELVLAEWDHWQRLNGGKNKYRMAGGRGPA